MEFRQITSTHYILFARICGKPRKPTKHDMKKSFFTFFYADTTCADDKKHLLITFTDAKYIFLMIVYRSTIKFLLKELNHNRQKMKKN